MELRNLFGNKAVPAARAAVLALGLTGGFASTANADQPVILTSGASSFNYTADVNKTIREWETAHPGSIAVGVEMGEDWPHSLEITEGKLLDAAQAGCPGIQAEVFFENRIGSGTIFSVRSKGLTDRNVLPSKATTVTKEAAQHLCTDRLLFALD